MYNSDNPATDNVIPLYSKSTNNYTKRKKNKSRENITIIPSNVNDVFNRVPIKETYCKLVMLADESGSLIIRIRTLAKFLNTGEKTISRNLKELHIRGLIIKDKFMDEYNYQKMIIHIVNYNKLAEKDTYVGKPGKDVVGQLVNNQLYDRDTSGQIITKQFYETLPFSNELTKDFYDLPKQIQESGSPYNEIQMFDKRIKTDDRKAHASEHDIVLANQPPLPSHKPTTSVSGAVSYISDNKKTYISDNNKKTSDEDVEYLVRLLMGFGTKEGQAKQMIDTYGYNVVLDKVNYVKKLENIDRKGAYLMGVLKAYGKKNGINPPHKPTTPEEKQASEDRAKLCQEHLVNIRKWFSKNYLTIESYINNPLVSQKHIIFELSKVLQGNVLAAKNEALNELLNGNLITIGGLHKMRDRLIGENPNQLMEEDKTNQGSSKNIVPHQVEKANKNADSSSPEPVEKATEKPSAGIVADIIERTGGANSFMAKVLAAKNKTNVSKVEQNRMVNEAFVEAVKKSNPTNNGSLFKNEPVSEPVGSQLNQAFSLKTDSKNEPVQNENEPVKLTSPKVDQTSHTLSDRQNKIIAYISKANKPSTQDISNQFTGVSKSSIKRDIKKLIELEKIRTEGEKKFTYYCLND